MQRTSKRQTISLISRSADFACLVAAFSIASEGASITQRMGFFVWPEHRPSDIAGWPAHYAALLLSSVILWGAISSCLRIHKRFSNAQAPCAFRLLLGTVVLWAGATAFAIFLLKLQSLSRQFTITYLTLAGLGII